MSSPVQIVDPFGKINESSPWFEQDEELGGEWLRIVAILGSQASGKSTLANELFNCGFTTGSRGKIGQSTTSGIVAGKASGDPRFCVLDVESVDSRDRGREGRVFQKRFVSFVVAVADLILLNVWRHDAGRVDSVANSLLRSVFEATTARIKEGNEALTALVFVIRDSESREEERVLADQILADARDIWKEVEMDAGLPVGGDTFHEHFDTSVVHLAHIRFERAQFEKSCDELHEKIISSYLSSDKYSRSIEADGFPMIAASLWDSQLYSGDGGDGAASALREIDAGDTYYSGEDFAIVAAYRCDEVFSDLLVDASKEIDDLLREVEAGTKVSNLGNKCEKVISHALDKYENETADFVDEPVHARKRRELEAIIDTGLMAVYMKQIQLIREEALAAFKAQISDDMSADFAFFTADTQFVQASREAKRPSSSWSCDAERSDLQNMMSEISQQHKKLLTTKMTASQNSAKAMQFLQMQHAQVQAIRQQALGGAVGQWNAAAVYRPPDTNVNISLGYQQGRTNLQVSMVPDESASLLGPSGFTAGVGPANLGLSFNINM